MEYFKYISVFFLVALFSCEEGVKSDLTNFVSFEAKPVIKVPANATETFDIAVAASTVSGTARTYNVNVLDNGLTISNQIPAQVTIPANSNVGNLTITLTDDDSLGFDTQTFTLSFEPLANIRFGNDLSINVSQRCDDTVVDLIITTDNWPDETTWELYDLNGPATLIASGGPYNNPADDFTDILEQFCLAPGDYGIVVFDSFGDGIEDGGYEILVDGTSLVSGTVGGSSAQSEFTIE